MKYQICTNRVLLIPRTKAEIEEIINSEINILNNSMLFHKLYQIKSLRDIKSENGVIPCGTYGGFVEYCCNLDTLDESWIEEGVAVYQAARITNNSYIKGNAYIQGMFLTKEKFIWIASKSTDFLFCNNTHVRTNEKLLFSYNVPVSKQEFEHHIAFMNEKLLVDSQYSIKCFDKPN